MYFTKTAATDFKFRHNDVRTYIFVYLSVSVDYFARVKLNGTNKIDRRIGCSLRCARI